MCGFFGILLDDERLRPDSDDLHYTAKLLSHRGPDHQGVHVGDGIGKPTPGTSVDVNLPLNPGVYEIRAGCDGSLQSRCIPSQASCPAVHRGEP